MSLFAAENPGGGKGNAAGPSIVVQFDGGSRGNPGPAGIGVTLSDESGDIFYELGEYLGSCTNNVAEYTALVRGLAAAKTLGAGKVIVKADSELVVRQINGVYKVKSPDLKPLYQRAVALIEELKHVKVVHVYREGNTRADELANMAMDRGIGKIEPLGPVGGFAGPGRKAKKENTKADTELPPPIRGLDALLRAVRALRKHDGELSIRELEALLVIAESPGCSQIEISHAMELSDAMVYRIVVEGLILRCHYVRQAERMDEGAAKQFFITRSGHSILDRAMDALGHADADLLHDDHLI